MVHALGRKNGFAGVEGSRRRPGIGYAWRDFIPNA